MIYTVFDDKDGVLLQVDFENGFAMGIKMDDEDAYDLAQILLNKVGERGYL